VNLSDVHVPYQDSYAVGLAFQIVRRVKPDAVNVIGDLADFYKLSRFDKDPDAFDLQDELDGARRFFILLRRVHRGTVRFLPGNHELRLHKYLNRNPELHGLEVLTIPNLLKLEEYDVEYFDHEIEIVPGRLVAKHGDVVRKYAGYSAKGELERDGYGISTITGHTHRLASVHSTYRGERVVGIENGCLCDLNPEYVRNPNWQHGLSIVEVLADGTFSVTAVPFLGRGKEIHAIVFGEEISL
jgi:predicted phosphodiesterase